MKKIFIFIFASILFFGIFGFGDLVNSADICEISFTDAEGKTHSADDWCNFHDSPPFTGCDSNQFYDFCVGNTHYHFSCHSPVFNACNCNSVEAYLEECGECTNWTCESEVGCEGGNCEKADCPEQCCEADDHLYFEKSCAFEGQICQNRTCVSQPCPATYECCTGAKGYESKPCPDGYYCSDENKCEEQPDELEDCPWECCISEEGYKNKLCGEGNCVNHECLGNGNGGNGGNGGSWGISFELENPLKAESFEELIDNIINFIFVIAIAIVPLVVIIAGIYFITSGGDPIKISTAKKMILYAAIGFAIILLAKGLIAVLKAVLGVKETTVLPLFFSSLKSNLKNFTFKRSSKFRDFIKKFL